MVPSQAVPTADVLLQRDPDFRKHLEALGLGTADEYIAWCARNGFSPRLAKHWRDRCRERFVASQEAVQRRLALAKDQRRKPRQTIERLFAGELGESDLSQSPLRLIHRLLVTLNDSLPRQAFQEIILHVHSATGLLSVGPALPQLGMQPGNTYIEALLALAQWRTRWARDLAAWRPLSHNVRKQFSSLTAHLLAKYRVPAFMDSAWFHGSTERGAQQQQWYLALAAGASPRRLELPIPLTKKMVHYFLQAPPDFSMEAALRWGQVLGLGGSARLARAVLGSRLGGSFENNDFWTSVIRWLVDQPLLDAAQVGPIIDYIHHQKFEPQIVEHGTEELEQRPLQPGFSMQGRSPESLLAQMRLWHASLRKQAPRPDLEWPPSGFAPFEFSEGTLAAGTLRKWAIQELCSRRELICEGNVMRHCVASYESSCCFGRSSIWSLTIEPFQGRQKRVLTIEVANQRKTICQIRGKANRRPSQKELEMIGRWAVQAGLTIDSYVAL